MIAQEQRLKEKLQFLVLCHLIALYRPNQSSRVALRGRLCVRKLGKCWLRTLPPKQNPARNRTRMNSSSKMKMNSKRELHQLYSQFVRIWNSGEKAKLNLRSENGAVKASLEINLGNPHAAPTDASTATSGRPQDHEARRTRRHRSAASKARSRARAARHQAAKTKTAADNTAPVLPTPPTQWTKKGG